MKLRSIIVLLFISILGHARVVDFYLASKMDGIHPMWNGHFTNIWGFGHLDPETLESRISLPAPTLRVMLGDTVNLHFYNPSEEGHTIHLHGLDVDQANDGVPSTSFYVLNGQWATYSFVANHAGNFIYHCHVVTTLHLTMGMYGMVIVESDEPNELYPGGPRFDKEYPLLFSDMELAWNDDYTTGGSLSEFHADQFLINGLSRQMVYDSTDTHVRTQGTQTVLLRLMNIAFSSTRIDLPPGISGVVYSSDGRPLPSPISVSSLEIYPGERYSMIMTIPESYRGLIRVTHLDLNGKRWLGESIIPINGAQGYSFGESESILYPNPSNGWVHFNKVWEINEIRITSNDGRLIYSGKPTSEGLDLRGVASPGTYLCEIYHQDGKRVIRKLVFLP